MLQPKRYLPFGVYEMDPNWRNVYGYEGIYIVSIFGEIRRIYKTKTKIMTPYFKRRKKSHGYYVVKMTKDGKPKEEIVSHIVWKSFKGEIPDGYRVVHRNRMKDDNFLNNLELLKISDLGNRYGKYSKKMPVVKINKDGDFVEFYGSARECARENYMSYQTVMDRCNGKVKKAFAPDGYEYAWEDSGVSVKHALERIKKYGRTNEHI